MKFALISVSDKTGIVEFARTLSKNSYSILASGGTFKTLKESNINAIEVKTIQVVKSFCQVGLKHCIHLFMQDF